MKNLFLVSLFFIASCANKIDDPLIIPPNYSEIPDAKNPEKQSEQSKDVEIQKIKELLLKSE